MKKSTEQESKESGLTELLQVINNPQHELDIELPRKDPTEEIHTEGNQNR